MEWGEKDYDAILSCERDRPFPLPNAYGSPRLPKKKKQGLSE